jgi:hypothetical protein
MNKFLICVILLSFIVNTSIAQYKVPNDSTNSRFFVGVTAFAIGFDLDYAKEPKGGNIHPYASLNLGYKVNSRLRLQAGIWYGSHNRNNESTYVESEDRLIHFSNTTKTRGIGVPITADYIIFYPIKRLQFYGTAMLTPMYSITKDEKFETADGITKVNYSEKTSGLNAYITGGFGFAYPISQRLDAYTSLHVISRSFRKGLRPRDEYPYDGSFAIGLNYRLK